VLFAALAALLLLLAALALLLELDLGRLTTLVLALLAAASYAADRAWPIPIRRRP
jgi:hypothetical protein